MAAVQRECFDILLHTFIQLEYFPNTVKLLKSAHAHTHHKHPKDIKNGAFALYIQHVQIYWHILATAHLWILHLLMSNTTLHVRHDLWPLHAPQLMKPHPPWCLHHRTVTFNTFKARFGYSKALKKRFTLDYGDLHLCLFFKGRVRPKNKMIYSLSCRSQSVCLYLSRGTQKEEMWLFQKKEIHFTIQFDSGACSSIQFGSRFDFDSFLKKKL